MRLYKLRENEECNHSNIFNCSVKNMKQKYSLKLHLFILTLCCLWSNGTTAQLEVSANNQNISEMAIALSEIAQGLQTTKTITILNPDNRKSSAFNEFIMEIHRLQLETYIFNETREFFKFIEANLKGSVEVTALIFHNPDELIEEVSMENFKFKNKISFHLFSHPFP